MPKYFHSDLTVSPVASKWNIGVDNSWPIDQNNCFDEDGISHAPNSHYREL
jgi:hypothetical protein